MSNQLKRGDRVRHRMGGWLATVTEIHLNTVVVKADSDSKQSGEYSDVVFEKVADFTQPVVEDPTTEGPR